MGTPRARATVKGLAKPFPTTIAAVLACVPAVVWAAEPAPSAIAWAKDWKAAQKEARASGRPLLVDFWAEWCHWCHELDRVTYAAPEVVELSRGFVAVKVDAEGGLGELELTRRFEVGTLPTIAFVSAQGRLLLKRTSFEDPGRFAATLRSAARLAAEAGPFEAALVKSERDAAALAGLGAVMFRQGFLAEAEALLGKARRFDRPRPLAERRYTRALLSEIALARGRSDDVRKLQEEAAALRPDGDAAGKAAAPPPSSP